MGYLWKGEQLWYVNGGVTKIIETDDPVPARDILFFEKVYPTLLESATGPTIPELTDYYTAVGPTGPAGAEGPEGPTGDLGPTGPTA